MKDDWIGARIAVTVWIVVSIVVYLCGVLIPWDSVWLGLGVGMAPLYAGALVLPIIYAFDIIDRRFLATLWSLTYLGGYFSVAVLTGWWHESETALTVWPIFLPIGSAFVATVASAPFIAIAAIWDDFDVTLRWPFKGMARKIGADQLPPVGIMEELNGDFRRASAAVVPEWDIFVSHASEDKADFVRPLAERLVSHGLRVWLDEVNLTVGDSLNRKIEAALSMSRFGVVVVSPSFLRKEWPRRELDGLTAREHDGGKVILPVWHGVKFEDVQKCSPMLASRLAVDSARGVDHVVDELLRAVAASE